MGPLLSVVIPTWNEAPLVADAVACAARIGDEVIVADGGSTDGTAAIARGAGAVLVEAPKGRGAQLRAAAPLARGEVFLILHADARLPASAREAIFVALADPQVPGGNFLVRFFPESWFTRLLVPGNDLRRKLTRRYYGDSGVFIRSSALRELGGVEPWPVMHDYDLSARMERAGRGAYLREPSVLASARRFEGREIGTLMRWLSIQSLYRLGLSPRLLGKAYPDVRGSDPEGFIAESRRQHG